MRCTFSIYYIFYFYILEKIKFYFYILRKYQIWYLLFMFGSSITLSSILKPIGNLKKKIKKLLNIYNPLVMINESFYINFKMFSSRYGLSFRSKFHYKNVFIYLDFFSWCSCNISITHFVRMMSGFFLVLLWKQKIFLCFDKSQILMSSAVSNLDRYLTTKPKKKRCKKRIEAIGLSLRQIS